MASNLPQNQGPAAPAAAKDSLISTAGHHSSSTITIGTRKSRLALIQTELVLKALREAWPGLNYKVESMNTMGDKDKVTPLPEFNAKSLWTSELEALLLDGQLDLVVHSLKDMPTQLPPSLKIGAIFSREDPRDALVMKHSSSYKNLSELPLGSIVGTSSVRRAAQIRRKFPHLEIADVRGNVETRLRKLDAEDGVYACLILAAAGLERLDLGRRITQHLDARNGGLLHAVGQGALGIEVRAGDIRVEKLLEKLGDTPTTLACLAERSLMRTLEGGCSVPIGVETEWQGSSSEKSLKMRAVVVSIDGMDSVEAEAVFPVENEEQAEECGKEMAQQLASKGANNILKQLTASRGK